MAAYGLYSHIQSNKRRSIALLIGLFFLVYVFVHAGRRVVAFTVHRLLDVLMRRAVTDTVNALSFAMIGTTWITACCLFVSMIDALTGGCEVTRMEQSRLCCSGKSL